MTGTGINRPATSSMSIAAISRLMMLPNSRTASASVRENSPSRWKGSKMGLGDR